MSGPSIRLLFVERNPNVTSLAEHTVDSEIFARILFSRIALKDILCEKFRTKARFTYINQRQSGHCQFARV